MRISIAVCTAGRPELLRACLELIIAQEGPAGSELRLIVIDNNQLPDAEPIAAEIAGKSPFPVHYVHESRLGIPFARNRAIDTALALKSDWIAFIDDDHEATPGWLAGLIQAARKHRADVVQGRLIKLYPHRLPLFAVATQLAQVKEGEALATASTHSVAFASWLVRPDKAALRFDETLRFSTAAASAFFRQAKKKGAKIVATEGSLAIEREPAERLSFRWQFNRELRLGANAIAAMQKAGLPKEEQRREVLRLTRKAALGAAELVISPVFLLGGWANFQRKVAVDLFRIGRAFGAWRGVRGHGSTGDMLPKPRTFARRH